MIPVDVLGTDLSALTMLVVVAGLDEGVARGDGLEDE